jgi:predicted nucleic acid-binding protein
VLSAAARTSLSARFTNFLHSTDPEDEKLKLYLTQGFYFIQLLGFDAGHFDPLADEAFRNAIFYVDTNVILPAVVLQDANAKLFEEVVTISTQLGFSLRVTRATINEARRVAARRQQELEKVIPHLTEELTEHNSDPFLTAFIAARDLNDQLTAQEFLKPFDDLPATLAKMGLVIEDKTEDEMIRGRDLRAAETAIQEEAQTRGWGKSEDTLIHDLAHYVLVEDERTTHPKTWFLTRDRTLAQAAARLATGPEQPPFSFGLITFLQSISPFLTAPTAEHSLAAVVSRFLTENIFPMERVFDLQDLAVIADTYEDAFATPPERLIPALDYVKRRVLQGRAFGNDDMPKIALELRKFVARSADEQQRLLEADAERLKAELAQHREAVKAERKQRLQAEHSSHEQEQENTRLQAELDSIRATEREQANEISQLRSDFVALAEITRRRSLGRQILLGLAIGASLLWFNVNIQSYVCAHSTLQNADYVAAIVLRLVSILFLVIPGIRLIRRLDWSGDKSTAAIAVILALAIGLSRVIDNETVGKFADLLGVVGVIAVLIVRWKK